MRDPIRENLARAESRLASFESWGAETDGNFWKKHLARGVVVSLRGLVKRRADAVDYEEEQRLKLLRGDPSSRCMFLKG